MNAAARAVARRLERAELKNLRAAVADLACRVEYLEAELERANGRAYDAELTADMWHDIAEAEGKQVTLVLQS